MIIALDSPITVAGASVIFVSIRKAMRADIDAAAREIAGMSEAAVARFAAEVLPDLKPGASLASELVCYVVLRRITGLPLTALAQITEADQAKFGPFLSAKI